MKLTQQFITKNPCYKAGKTIQPKGVMVHSTATPGVMAEQWYSRWNKSTVEKAVHAFVDDTTACQHLPWNHRAWHCGNAANNTHISFEICEPTNWKSDGEYFKKAYQNAVELTAFLCKQYNLDASSVISHKEGYQRGIASNHGDPDHWWRYFGYTMERFRADVKKTLNGQGVQVEVYQTRPVLQCGDTGADVELLQKRLNEMKSRLNLEFENLVVDGIFGEKTKNATKMFQKARNLTVDGIVGPKTWDALEPNYGDVNADGKVNAVDAQKVLKAAVGKDTLTEKQKKAADMNADGKVNAVDAQHILKRAVGK